MNNKKIADEFLKLSDKSKILFGELRDLPEYGRKWQNYFENAFEVFTKLWKFQQQHREILDQQLGLKRWQVGEIASKIGQLYYHYYLRTNDPGYLNESFSFYSAIKRRSYFKLSSDERSELVLKKFRYFARFIVICLLLRKFDLVNDLIMGMSQNMADYKGSLSAASFEEWSRLCSEAELFAQAEQVVLLEDGGTRYVCEEKRLRLLPPATTTGLRLRHAVIVGSKMQQAAFSELTIDMYRALFMLEHQFPTGDGNEGPDQLLNPSKILLFCPTVARFLSAFATSTDQCTLDDIILLYFSCNHRDFGKGMRNANSEGLVLCPSDASSPVHPINCLFLDDLQPFTRYPLFVIADSESRTIFEGFQSRFDRPLVCLMSPSKVPDAYTKLLPFGSLFTLFLYCPVTALSVVCHKPIVAAPLWSQAQQLLYEVEYEISILCSKSKRLSPVLVQFLSDDFCRILLARFVICYVTMRLHQNFKADKDFRPRSIPAMSEDIIENDRVSKMVLELAQLLGALPYFISAL